MCFFFELMAPFVNHLMTSIVQVPSGTAPDGTGLIGLGSNTGSNILIALNGSATGDTPLDNIFRQNTSTPNYITFLLNRQNDTAGHYPGAMTISEVLPQYSNLSSQPKVPVAVLQGSAVDDQHWTILLDKDGIIGPDGNVIKITSNATGSSADNANQLVALFDTGFTLPQVPRCVAQPFFLFKKKRTH